MLVSYSKKTSEFLKAKGIEDGDSIRVDKAGVVYEGLLMPRATGDEDALVIKLKSGYNVGVTLSEKTVVEKLASKKFHPALEKIVEARKPAHGLPKVTLIATGGTIVSHVDYSTGGVIALTKPEDLVAQFPDLLDACFLHKIVSPITVMSEDVSSQDWVKISHSVHSELKESDGIIITHGTDALGFTAAALSFMLSTRKTIALVGAQRSPDRGSFDGALNLACAAHFIAKANYPGVCVVMHGSSSDDFCLAHSGVKVRKMHSSRRDAFQSINALPLAKIYADGRVEEKSFEHSHGHDEGKPHAHSGPGHAGAASAVEAEEKADAVFEEKIALIKAYPDSDPEMLEWLVEKGKKGIIIEAMGLGHVPTNSPKSWIPNVKNAVEKGVFVGITTQTLYGSVSPFVYSNLRKLSGAGAVFLKDGLPETMFVKLGWVLGHKSWSDKVESKMLENVRGEFNARLADSGFALFK